MANEAVLMFETSLPIPFICANATAIPYGTVVKLADPFTVSASSVLGEVVGGITAAEKIASDGVTTVPVWRSGIFKLVGSGNITAGDPVCIAVLGLNKVEKAATNEEDILGTALETSADGETLLVELKPFGISLA